MSAQETEWDDMLPDEAEPPTGAEKGPEKGTARPLVRSGQQSAKQIAAAERRQAARDLAAAQTQAQQTAARLAQVVNLHIAGFSLAQIGASIGATEAEVDAMLTRDTARYVKNQPALRVYVRNWVSERLTKMIEADYAIATDVNHLAKLDNQDRVLRMLDRVAKLHGADAPTQTEVKVDAAPEAVEAMVAALAQSAGYGYDASVFDTVPGDVVHKAVEQSHDATVVSGNQVGVPTEEDEDGF